MLEAAEIPIWWSVANMKFCSESVLIMNNLLFQINNEGYTNFKNASRLQYSTLWSHTKDLHCQEGLYLHVTDWQLSISTWIWVGVTLMAIQLSFYSYISSKANSLIRKVDPSSPQVEKKILDRILKTSCALFLNKQFSDENN